MKEEKDDSILFLNKVNEYIDIIQQLIDISIDYSNVLVDNIFNIKFSLSILKGGIFDFQKGHNLSDINNEVKSIEDNLSNSSRLVRMTKTKAVSFKEQENVKYIDKNDLHGKMVREFARSIERFLNVFKNRVLDKEFDLINSLQNKGLNKITRQEVDKWFNIFFSINNTGFNMIKSNKKNAK